MSRKVKKACTLLILSAMLLMTGCMDIKSIEDLAIPIASGYEILTNNETGENKVQVFGVFPVFYKNAPENVFIDATEGSLIGETRTTRYSYLSETLELGSLQVAILGPNLAKYGVYDALGIIYRTPQMKNTIMLAVSDDSIDEIFKVKPPNYPNVGTYMMDLLKHAYAEYFLPISNVHTLNVNINTPGCHAIMPVLSAQHDKIMITGYGIFTKDRMAYKIPLVETRILGMLRGSSIDGSWSYRITDTKGIPYSVSARMVNKVKVKVTRSGEKYRFNITVNAKGSLEEIVPNENLRSLYSITGKSYNLLKDKQLRIIIEDSYEKMLEDKINALVNKAQQEYKMDIFNWSRYALAKWRNDIEKADWDKLFSNAEITVKVKATIKNTGERT